eukprot:5959886-Pleurochrysis_carterae.AAC.1
MLINGIQAQHGPDERGCASSLESNQTIEIRRRQSRPAYDGKKQPTHAQPSTHALANSASQNNVTTPATLHVLRAYVKTRRLGMKHVWMHHVNWLGQGALAQLCTVKTLSVQ